jgi:hypothetical protein
VDVGARSGKVLNRKQVSGRKEGSPREGTHPLPALYEYVEREDRVQALYG